MTEQRTKRVTVQRSFLTCPNCDFSAQDIDHVNLHAMALTHARDSGHRPYVQDLTTTHYNTSIMLWQKDTPTAISSINNGTDPYPPE